MRPRQVLFAPSLDSPGGYAALRSQYASQAFDTIIVRRPELVPTPLLKSSTVALPSLGHRSGYRILRDLAATGPLDVYVAQNPAFVPPGVRVVETLVQNHLFAHPWLAVRHSLASPGLLARVFVGLAATELQLLRSQKIVVLNTDVPRHWRWGRELEVRTNRIPSLDVPAATQRKSVVFVGSYDPFRGLDLALKAFVNSHLIEHGWAFVVHARSSDRGYERRLKRQYQDVDSIDFEPSCSSWLSLAEGGMAVFPSVIEGASIAFAESLQLTRRVLALDRRHFRQQSELLERPSIDWVERRHAAAWAEAMRQAAGLS